MDIFEYAKFKIMAGKGGGGSGSGEPIAICYGRALPDINSVWTGELKQRLPFAIILMEYDSRNISLLMIESPLISNANNEVCSTTDVLGVETCIYEGKWEERSVDDIDYRFYADEPIFGKVILWSSEPVRNTYYDGRTIESESAPIYE